MGDLGVHHQVVIGTDRALICLKLYALRQNGGVCLTKSSPVKFFK